MLCGVFSGNLNASKKWEKKLSFQLDQMSNKMVTLCSTLVPVVESLSAEAHNLWTNTQLSDPASRPSQDYRKKFLEYLGYKTKKDRTLCPCMLTGVVGNSNIRL